MIEFSYGFWVSDRFTYLFAYPLVIESFEKAQICKIRKAHRNSDKKFTTRHFTVKSISIRIHYTKDTPYITD